MIYLDNAATTKPKQEVIDAMLPYLTEKWYNPSSLYSNATAIKHDVESVRNSIGRFIGANGNEIFITSSGSEGNCWVVQGFVGYCNRINKNATIITSTIEHKSILECVKYVNANVCYVGVDEHGLVNMEMLEELVHNAHNEANRTLVSIQFANNEIGVIQNIGDIAKLTHKYNAVFHTDAVQAFGQVPINVDTLGIDMMTVSGHKIGAPKGIGFLYKKNGVDIDPLIYGSQMDSMRGGTENVPYIIGLGEAIKYCDVSQKRILEMYDKTDCFIEFLKFKFGCRLNGASGFRLPNNVNVTFPQNITGEALLYMLDLSGISISTGSACNSSSIEPSHVLKAIGLSDEDAMRTVRFTISPDTTYEDINKVIDEIDKTIRIIES